MKFGMSFYQSVDQPERDEEDMDFSLMDKFV